MKTLNYAQLRAKANAAIQQVGFRVKVNRNGSTFTSGFAVFVERDAADETTSVSNLLAQTTINNKQLLLSGVAKEVLVGDQLVADKQTWTVQAVNTVRPTNVTLLYQLEVS